MILSGGKYKKKRNWKEINEKYVREGELWIDDEALRGRLGQLAERVTAVIVLAFQYIVCDGTCVNETV